MYASSSGSRREKYGRTVAPLMWARRLIAVFVMAGSPKNGINAAPLPVKLWSAA